MLLEENALSVGVTNLERILVSVLLVSFVIKSYLIVNGVQRFSER